MKKPGLAEARAGVEAASARLGADLLRVRQDGDRLRRGIADVAPGAIVALGFGAGFLFTVLPRRLRMAALIGVADLAMGRLPRLLGMLAKGHA